MTKEAPEIINRLQAGVSPALAMLAGMQLEIFTALGENQKTASEIAARLSLDEGRLSRLLYALVLTGLLVRENERFANSPEAKRFLVKGKPDYLGGAHELIADLWHADLQTAKSIRSGRPAALHDFDSMDEVALSAFLRGLQSYAFATGQALAEQFDFSRCGSVIDIGGGSGATLLGLLAKNARMRGTLFELAKVARAARPLLSDAAGTERIEIEIGDIVAAPPKGLHDAAILRAVIQVLSPQDAASAIRHAFECLRPGGTVFITGSGIIADDRLHPTAGVYLNLTLMNLYPAGAAYTVSTHFDWLRQAGFDDPHRATLPNGSEVISATRI
jgi:SAM-dependent methyltransferase